MRSFFYLIICLLAFSQCSTPAKQSLSTNISTITPKDSNIIKIAFGSCNKTNKPQNYWQKIATNQADYWLWLGDIIYADTEDMSKMKSMYDEQKSNPFYQEILNATTVYGIWDDHDYGANDGGKMYPKKSESKALLFDFLDYSMNETNSHEGAYHAVTIEKSEFSVKLIFLDTRYFRDELKKNPTGKTRYLINKTGDILGEKQWKWLEEELENNTTNLTIISSSIQVIPEEQIFEKWANFPTARKRFLNLLNQTKTENIILLSGDRHIAEVSKIKLKNRVNPIYEITSSGLTHAYENPKAKLEKNKYRVGELVNQRNFGILNINITNSKCSLEIKNMDNESLISTQIIK